MNVNLVAAMTKMDCFHYPTHNQNAFLERLREINSLQGYCIGAAFRDPGGRKCPDQGCANWGRQKATDMMHRRRATRCAETSAADRSALQRPEHEFRK